MDLCSCGLFSVDLFSTFGIFVVGAKARFASGSVILALSLSFFFPFGLVWEGVVGD